MPRGQTPGRGLRGRLEEELAPGGPPVLGAGGDRDAVDDLDAVAVAVTVDEARVGEDGLDLARLARVVGWHAVALLDGLLRTCLDELPRSHRRQVPGARAPQAPLHGHRDELRPEKLRRLAADHVVAGDEHDRAAPRAAEGRVDAGFADRDAVEAKIVVLPPGDRVAHDAARRSRLGVHGDEERRVAALLQHLGVLRPLVLHDPLAVGVEELRDERVERPALARPVAVHDDDLVGARRLRASYCGVDLLGVELARLLVERLAAVHLLPLDDARDALHVADHEDPHAHAPTRSSSSASTHAAASLSASASADLRTTSTCGPVSKKEG